MRQKSCRNCAIAKSRCDLKRPCCSRCASRRDGDSCSYPAPSKRNGDLDKPHKPTSAVLVLCTPTSTGSQTLPPRRQNEHPLSNDLFGVSNPLAYRRVDLREAALDAGDEAGYGSSSCGTDTPTSMVNTLDLLGMDNDQMTRLFPQSAHSDTTPLLVKHSMQALLRLLRTWPRIIVKGFQLPPIFHPSMTSLKKPLPQPLSNCFTLARMWDGQCDGASTIVQETVLKETKTIFTNVGIFTFITQVAEISVNIY